MINYNYSEYDFDGRPIPSLEFMNFPLDLNSSVIPGKLFISSRASNNTQNYKTIRMHHPVQVKNMSLIIICTGGMGTISINLNEESVVRGVISVVTPGSFLQIKNTSEDFNGIIIAQSRDFTSFVGDITTGMKLLKRIDKRPFYNLNETELQEAEMIINFMRNKLDKPKFKFKEQFAKNCLNILQCVMIEEQMYKTDETQSISNSRKEEIFSLFIKEVETYYKKERSVSFYADRICISPKYLSSVIHETSGKYATDWINGYVILEAKALLSNKRIPIKEVCNMLNFANQSFFAKYFKQHTGMTPKEYKNNKT